MCQSKGLLRLSNCAVSASHATSNPRSNGPACPCCIRSNVDSADRTLQLAASDSAEEPGASLQPASCPWEHGHPSSNNVVLSATG